LIFLDATPSRDGGIGLRRLEDFSFYGQVPPWLRKKATFMRNGVRTNAYLQEVQI